MCSNELMIYSTVSFHFFRRSRVNNILWFLLASGADTPKIGIVGLHILPPDLDKIAIHGGDSLDTPVGSRIGYFVLDSKSHLPQTR